MVYYASESIMGGDSEDQISSGQHPGLGRRVLPGVSEPESNSGEDVDGLGGGLACLPTPIRNRMRAVGVTIGSDNLPAFLKPEGDDVTEVVLDPLVLKSHIFAALFDGPSEEGCSPGVGFQSDYEFDPLCERVEGAFDPPSDGEEEVIDFGSGQQLIVQRRVSRVPFEGIPDALLKAYCEGYQAGFDDGYRQFYALAEQEGAADAADCQPDDEQQSQYFPDEPFDISVADLLQPGLDENVARVWGQTLGRRVGALVGHTDGYYAGYESGEDLAL